MIMELWNLTGGTLPYTFVWDNLTGQMNDTAHLTPGIHTVIVTDAEMYGHRYCNDNRTNRVNYC